MLSIRRFSTWKNNGYQIFNNQKLSKINPLSECESIYTTNQNNKIKHNPLNECEKPLPLPKQKRKGIII